MENEILRIAGINYDSMVDGDGVRTAIFLSGCQRHCPDCHNADLQNPEAGTPVNVELTMKIAEEINKRPYLSGITLTGGDPLYNHKLTSKFLRDLKAHINRRINVWLYTGERWEDIWHRRIMRDIDVVVDGPFVKELADKRLAFRGSSNQRIIDVQKSLREGGVSLYVQH